MPDNGNGFIKSAVENGWIYKLNQSPQYVFRKPMCQLITVIKNIFIDQLARKHSFEEWIFPRLVPEEVLSKTGWLNNHREEAWFLSSKREFDYHLDEEGLFSKHDRFPTKLQPYALDPIQCVSLYYALFNSKISGPIKVFEHQGGWSFRHEVDFSGLIRGIEFLRLEFVWLGDMDFVIRTRNEVVKTACEILETQFRFSSIRCAPGDSCFEEPSQKEYPQNKIVAPIDLRKLECCSSIDIIIDLDDIKELELASSSRYDKLGAKFKIALDSDFVDQRYAWSGCLGLGLTRIATSFLKCNGFDPNKWDKKIKVASEYLKY